ncbi:MAG: site-specific integrase [Pseudonocardiaceae bacterium]
MTFREFAEQWRTTAPHGPSTRDLVARRLGRHVYPALGDLQVGAIRTTRVQALVTILGATLAPSTVRVMHSYVVSIFRAAVRDKVIPSSPCEGVRLPAARPKQVEIPPLEVLDVLAAKLPERFLAVPALVAGSGLRQGEVFGLEVDGLDFLRGRSVDVHQQLVTLSGQPPYIGPVKTAE